MSNAWNLTSTQWAEVLLSGVKPEQIAKQINANAKSPRAAVLLRHIKDSHTILDLGSGRGQHSASIALAGKDTTLLDWSKENLEFSQKLFEASRLKARFCHADMLQTLPFKDNAFDTVFSCGVFEYFSDDEIVIILKEAFRVAKKSVIIMIPNALSIAYRVGMWYQKMTGNWEWGGERPMASLAPHYRKAGCNRITELTVGAKDSLHFLTMPCGRTMQNIISKTLKLSDHSERVNFKQGYLLVSVGEKA